ncbi:MAG TPA: triose-phosphate isomerase [Anaerolineales bacterium]|nr:triose-phosphate isomerase [Anaerolineales bacterium]HNA90217.1 triose-phosphate isomerase [Anaerolineales bacterium]HNB37134.1 triose-phosphate isomerase [Anaerolineales bacterium]HNC09243.1 triose-phosphate isomerase [Anaerolineales bacterium]
MRTSFVAGNWKMNKNIAETRDLLSALKAGLNDIKNVERVVCPPFIALNAASEVLAGSEVGLGAQNMHWEEKGAFTGEIAPGMVKEICGYVILGHSERRTYFGETDETVNKKLLAAEKAGLTPIVCVGETLAQYEAGQTADIVSSQTRLGLKGVSAEFAQRIVVAYEPVWAIGTGKASSAENAQGVHGVIRLVLQEMFGAETAGAIRILYGGSVTAANAAEFFSQPDIDGALVGGASLKVDDFLAIARAAVK